MAIPKESRASRALAGAELAALLAGCSGGAASAGGAGTAQLRVSPTPRLTAQHVVRTNLGLTELPCRPSRRR
jgi:hypothetical protein